MVEVFLVLYLLSGLFKALLTFGNFFTLPFDLTVFFGILSFSSLVIRNISQGWAIRYYDISVPLFFMFFWAWMFFSLSYTSSSLCGIPKVFLFGTNFLPLLIVVLCKDFNIRLFFKTFIMFVLGCSLIFLPLFQISLEVGYGDDDIKFVTAYLAIGLYLGISLLLNIKNPYFRFLKYKNLWFNIFLFLLLILTGARGPIVFYCICFFAIYISSHRINIHSIKIRKRNLFSSLLTLSIILCILVFLNRYYENALFELIERTISRLSTLVMGMLGMGDFDGSSTERGFYITRSWDIITSSPFNFFFGTGAGSFGVELYNIDAIGSPHNIILEVWLEFGLIGLILITLLFFSMIFRRKPCGNISVYVIIYLFLNLMKSGSLQEMRVFMTFFILYSYYPNLNKVNYEESCSNISLTKSS